MATLGSIPSNQDLQAGDNVNFASNLTRHYTVADVTARDALTNLRHGDRAMVTGLGDNGVEYFYSGTAWVIAGPQKLQRVDLAATAVSITLDQIVAGGSMLQVRYKLASDSTSTLLGLTIEIDGDATDTNYHSQSASADDGLAVVSEVANNNVAEIAGGGAPSTAWGTGQVDFDGYDDTDNLKAAVSHYQMLRQADRIRTGVRAVVHEDGGTSAIDTSIVLKPSAGNFISGSWAELWIC